MAKINKTQYKGTESLSVSSTRRLSIPLTLDEWEKMEYKPKEADRVDVWKGDSYHEYGLIIDVMLGQLGTTILFKYVK